MQSWDQGVELELHGVGAYRTVRSTEDAAHALLSHWPRGKGAAYLAAQQACLDALEGKAPPELARAAFIKAARAARIHIRSLEDPRAAAMAAGRNASRDFRARNRAAMAKVRHHLFADRDRD